MFQTFLHASRKKTCNYKQKCFRKPLADCIYTKSLKRRDSGVKVDQLLTFQNERRRIKHKNVQNKWKKKEQVKEKKMFNYKKKMDKAVTQNQYFKAVLKR